LISVERSFYGKFPRFAEGKARVRVVHASGDVGELAVFERGRDSSLFDGVSGIAGEERVPHVHADSEIHSIKVCGIDVATVTSKLKRELPGSLAMNRRTV